MFVFVAVQAPLINWSDLFSRARGSVDITDPASGRWLGKLKHETVAAFMGISAAQLSQQLSGQGHVSLFRLCDSAKRDPDAKRFVQALFGLLAEELGFSEGDPIAETLGSALMVLGSLVGKMQLRMARASLPEQHAQERRRIS